jgi:hypothetical protein
MGGLPPKLKCDRISGLWSQIAENVLKARVGIDGWAASLLVSDLA